MAYRWTVRDVDADALEMIRLVRAHCGLSMGVLLSDAIRVWYDALPEIDDDQ